MIYVMALTREATATDDRTWQMVTLESNPSADGIEIGSQYEDDGVTWKVADIFRDMGK